MKLNKAKKLAKIGKYPRTWADITAKISEYLIMTCTAKQLAIIADEMYVQHHNGMMSANPD